MPKAGVITIDLQAGTAKFIQDLEQANGKLRQFGQHGVSAMQATSGGLRLLEGNFTNNIRAVERFLATTLKLGPIIEKAFPVVGGIAFAGLLVEMTGKAYNFFKVMRDGPEKLAGGFRDLNNSLRTTNDELRLSNDRLENDIAKLEGKRQNNLKIALDEVRVAADKLGDSLDADLDKINKFLKENEVGHIKALLTGQARTDDLRESLFGRVGYGKFRADVDSAVDKGRAGIDASKTPEQAQAAYNAMAASIDKLYEKPLAELQKRIAEAEKKSGLNQAPTYQEYLKNPGKYAPYGAQAGQSNQDANLETTRELRRLFTEERDKALQMARGEALGVKKGGAEIDAANRAADRPYTDRLKALAAQLEEVRAKGAAIGQSESAQVLIKTYGDAVKVITEVNKALEEHHRKLSEAREGQITNDILTINQTEAANKWKDTLDKTGSSVRERITSQQLLTAAIGQGYEATKKANVETALMNALGKDYFDPAFMKSHAADIEVMRNGFGGAFDATHGTQVTSAIDRLQDQIKLEQAATAVQVQGAEAVRRAQLEVRLEKMREDGATEAQIKAERDLYAARMANVSAETTARLNEQADALERVTAAKMLSARAEREAALQNQLDAARRNGMPEGPSNQALAIGRNAGAEYQAQLADEALRASGDYQNQLDKIADTVALIRREWGNTLQAEIALRNLENDRLRIMVEQQLAQRRAADGLRAFFIEMQQQGKSTAAIIYEALNSALDTTSANMARLATGQKTAFGREFQQIGQQIIQSQIKNSLQGLLAQFGMHIGTPKGTPNDPQYVNVVNMPGGLAGPGARNSPVTFPSGTVFSGSQGGMIFNLLANIGSNIARNGPTPFGGARAMGGDVDPGSAFLVGEHGPELFRPPTAGSIVPNHKLGGGSVYYTIDARGSDLGASNRVARAIEAAHSSAIATGVQANIERRKRTPQKSSASKRM